MSRTASPSSSWAFTLPAALALFLAFAPAASAGGFLGVRVTGVPEQLALDYRLPAGIGAYVADVLPGGPAELAGIVPGDVLVRVDDELQYSPSLLIKSKATLLVAGRAVEALVFRGTRALRLTVTPSEAPGELPTTPDTETRTRLEVRASLP